MFPFSYTGLRLVHDEKVRDAMERAHIDAELTRSSRRAGDRTSCPSASTACRWCSAVVQAHS